MRSRERYVGRGGSDEKEVGDSVAILAERDPVFALAIQRRSALARTQALAIAAGCQYLGLHLCCLVRKVLTRAAGIVACLIAATIFVYSSLLEDMAPKMNVDPPNVLCTCWRSF